MQNEKVLVLDFGSEYNQLLTRKIRELNVYSEVYNYKLSVEEIKEMNPKGIILSGGNKSVHDDEQLPYDEALLDLDIPILGIGYGMSYMCSYYGGDVAKSATRIKETKGLSINESANLLEEAKQITDVSFYGGDDVMTVGPSFTIEATDEQSHVLAVSNKENNRYGLQFVPCDSLNEGTTSILKHFLFDVCNCSGDWSIKGFIDYQVEQIKAEVGDKKVLCGLSGGVDSSVVAVLLHEAIGDQLTCIFVDHGMLRKNEADEVMKLFEEDFHVNVIKVDAQEQFLSKLAGVDDPEEKRKIIGNEFINVFDAEAEKLVDIEFLAQGTLYSDVIESGVGTGEMIKSHHNVGGLPEHMELSLIEPISYLFKDEVRELGTALGMPDHIVWRQPFPGPGLGIRVLGEVTEDKLKIVREADAVLREEIANAGLDRKIWQYFAVLPDIRSVGVKNDARSYDYTVGIRAVHSVDGMTSEWAHIPYDVLDKISRRITNEVDYVNRVVYDISSKPPATIEWE